MAELAHIITDDETLKVSASVGLTPKEILSDADLERIMDRSPESYDAHQSDQSSRFQIVNDLVDKSSDALVGIS